jgi:hypothetical protein
MESQMANPHHGDLDLARGKESSIWALKLSKKHRKDMSLVSIYFVQPPTQRKSSLKPSLPFSLFSIFRQHLPKQTMGGRKEEEGWSATFVGHFWRRVRGWPIPAICRTAPTNGIFRGGSPLYPSSKWRPFLEAGVGWPASKNTFPEAGRLL